MYEAATNGHLDMLEAVEPLDDAKTRVLTLTQATANANHLSSVKR